MTKPDCWNQEKVVKWLNDKGWGQFASTFEKHNICHEKFLNISLAELVEYLPSAEGIDPNDDDEKTARMKKRIQDQLAKLKRNAERRRQRQLAKQAALAENPVLGLIRGKREGAMRRCGNCGQLGHMKTNKNCPNFYLMNDPIRSLTELPATLPTDTANTISISSPSNVNETHGH
ncbi:hypothetical protein RMATCC62417_11239 [Rhizopus microsporus]|nr:hypothetical protein RMATCC62417_11239 [Rhizopus microsporus]